MKDFFISYNKADEQWATWIAWVLEEDSYSVVIQAWDFRPGENFVLKMNDAAAETRKTIAVLSDEYINATYTQPEWAAAFRRDPEGRQRVLIPIRVKDCKVEGLLGSTIYIDLFGKAEEEARKSIFAGLKERAKPDEAPSFPADRRLQRSFTDRVIKYPVKYPGIPKPDDSSNIDIPSNLPTGIPFFTGREDVLTQLHEALMESGSTALSQRQALSGLGGIGKTQTALEYARRHRAEYKALLWAVAESQESLISDFVGIAGVLALPEAKVQDQTFTVKAVKRWLETNGGWLLILDNADDPTILEEFLPNALDGHLLLTSRAQVFDSLGILNAVEVEEMAPEDATGFLLRRTGRQDLDKFEAEAVEKLARELDYLPLALEQAGAYVKELRGSFQDYLASYQKRGLELLEKGQPKSRYGKSVRTTWSLNFQQAAQMSKASADLLRISAFLNPDRIPTEFISRGAKDLGPEISVALANVEIDPLALDELLNPLIRYSLIHRNRDSRSYDIHRLVQAVLRDGMDDSVKRLWAESVVQAMARVFPDVDAINPSEWEGIERLLPHAQACAELINVRSLESEEASKLLDLLGRYLHLRGRLSETRPTYLTSLNIREKTLGPSHPDVATSLHNLAWLYLDEGKYVDAEPLLIRSLAIRESTLGENNPSIATSLALLARLHSDQGRYAEGTREAHRSLEIREQVLGGDHQDTAESLLVIGKLYLAQDKSADAKPLLVRSLEIMEGLPGGGRTNLASVFGALGLVHHNRQQYPEAESFFLREIAIREKRFGPNYPPLAAGLNNLANLYIAQGKYAQAEPLLERALRIRETGLGPEHPDGMYSLGAFAHLYHRQGRLEDAESFYIRSNALGEKSLGKMHPEVAATLVNLGQFYYGQHKYSKGEPLLRRAINILKGTLGADNEKVARAMFLHAALLGGLNRKGEAQRLEAQARKLKAKLHRKNLK